MAALLMPLTVLLAVAAHISEGSYIVLVPKVMRPGIPFTVSTTIQNAAGNVKVTATLVQVQGAAKQESVISSGEVDIPSGTTEKVSLQIPVSVTTSGSYILRVTGSGGGLSFRNETKDIQVKTKSSSVFIQTNKAIYKPGQTVKFRAFSVNPELRSLIEPMKVEIYDSQGNKIKQWLHAESNITGVVSKEFPLSDQPVLGDWSIKVTQKGEAVTKTFTIEEYVLPKFEVTVDLPSYIALDKDKAINGQVKAKYTYGKSVKGLAVVTCEVKDQIAVVQKIQIEISETGGSFSCPLATFSQDGQVNYLNGRTVSVSAVVTEALTGNKLNGSSEVKIYEKMIQVSYLQSTPTSFKPGLMYTAFVKIAQPDGQPLMGSDGEGSLVVEYTVQKKEYVLNAPKEKLTVPVPASGIVKVDINLPSDAVSMNIQATYQKSSGGDKRWTSENKYVRKFKSRGNSGVQVSLKSTGTVKAGEQVTFQIKTSQSTTSVYQILNKGKIISSGQVTGGNGATFQVLATPEMAPNPRILVYQVTNDGEVIVDSLEFNVDGMFRNKVTLALTPDKVKPGEEVNVKVTASPRSYVALLAIDQSVLLLKTGNDITQEDVMKELGTYDSSQSDGDNGGCMDCVMPFARMMWFPFFSGGDDSSALLKKAGVIMMTDQFIFQGERYLVMESDRVAMAGAVPGPGAEMKGSTGQGQGELKQVTKMRSRFIETWLWTDVTTSNEGGYELKVDAPDTITSWVVSAFSVSKTDGLGVVPSPTKVQVFKPFFVSLNLPYSVKRGEEFELQAIVFNYMASEQQATVTLKQSSMFKVKESNAVEAVSKTATRTIPVKPNSGASVSFWIVPNQLGAVQLQVTAQTSQAADGVIRNLLVEPEGKEVNYNKAFLIDLAAGSSFSQNVPVTLPSTGLVRGSEVVKVSITGDMMGTSINGLDKLLRMPYGCGEQNMLNFAPSIFITKYLKVTSQMTSAIEEKATKIMDTGYQRELNYKHDDGSFSAFGNNDNSGSMWLSAFVVKSFHQAMPFTTIDTSVINKALNWMTKHQKPDGQFEEPGRVLHKELQGGSASGISMTAYVVIALLENKDLEGRDEKKQDNAIKAAKNYLETSYSTLNDSYALAIVTYALILAESAQSEAALVKLNGLSIEADGTKHWSPKPAAENTANAKTFQPTKPRSSDIEATAYALLCYVAKNDVSGGYPVLKWLMTQRNEFGGFSSTQDTVIGLQALSEFGAMVSSKEYSVDASVTAGQFQRSFSTITQTNALILQSITLPSTPTEVTITATGKGKAFVQVSVQYNINSDGREPDFNLIVNTRDKTNNEIEVKACTNYKGTEKSGMVVMEVGMLSGFEGDPSSVNRAELKGAELQRVESENQKLVLYFNEIGQQQTCVTVKTTRKNAVSNLKPALIKTYSYYDPGQEATNFYMADGIQNVDMCSLCVDCSDSCPKPTNGPVKSGHCNRYSVSGMILIFLLSLAATLFCFV